MTTEIHWAELAAAGLDTGRISTRRTAGHSQYVAYSEDGMVKVAFGKADSDEPNPTGIYYGWNIQSYAQVGTPDDPSWATEVYDHRLDASEVPAVVRDLLGETP